MRKFEVCSGYEGKAVLPMRGTKYSAGYDLYTINDKSVWVAPHETAKFETGIKACMEDDEVLMLYVRSSTGIKKGLVMANGTGVIDKDYYNNPKNEGNIIIALRNSTNEPVCVEPKSKVAQGVFVKYLVTDDDKASGERVGGIGSTSNS